MTARGTPDPVPLSSTAGAHDLRQSAMPPCKGGPHGFPCDEVTGTLLLVVTMSALLSAELLLGCRPARGTDIPTASGSPTPGMDGGTVHQESRSKPKITTERCHRNQDDASTRSRHNHRVRSSSFVIEVTVRQTYVRRAPSGLGRRWGVVRLGTKMEAVGVLDGPGCGGRWFQLARGGFVCSDQARAVKGRLGGVRRPIVPAQARLPGRYVLVGRDGSAEYADPEDLLADMPLRELAPGFGRTVVRRIVVEQVPMWKTTRGTYIPAHEVFRVRGSAFQGQPLDHGTRLPLVLVHLPGTRSMRTPRSRPTHKVRLFVRFSPTQIALTRGGPTGRHRTGRRRRSRHGGPILLASFQTAGNERLTRWKHRHLMLQLRKQRKRAYVRMPDGWWLRADRVRVALSTAPPPEAGPRTKWVDIDLAEQTLVAYEGPRPVYVTLVSTGRHGRTPAGLFRVWAKLAKTDMEGRGTNEDDEAPEPSYSMWDVPWTLYFKGGLAIHGTYWHGRFGRVRSHGCVNLSPADAKWLFEWSDPVLPPGWTAILPKGNEPTLLVRIRRGGIAVVPSPRPINPARTGRRSHPPGRPNSGLPEGSHRKDGESAPPG